MIENLFATPIYSCFLKNQNAIQLEIATAMTDIQYDDSVNYYQWGKTFQTTNVSADIIVNKAMQTLDQAIDYHLKKYCREIGFETRPYTRKSWIVKNSQGGHTHVHTHHADDITGVYYFQTTETDGNIFFDSPVGPAISSLCYQKYVKRHEHTPVVGKLLMFPGWLSHGVKTNTIDSDRISLAFSIVFSR
jgi:uncharacterized protein (TIGR02466 family)